MSNYLCTITMGDTDIEVYGYHVGPDYSVGDNGYVEIEDLIAVSKESPKGVSVYELIAGNDALFERAQEYAFEAVSTEGPDYE